MGDLKINFCSFPNGSSSQPIEFVKLMFSRFWGVLCQTVHPESNLRRFRSFLLFDSAFWFLLKTCIRIREDILKLMFAPSLIAPEIGRQSLKN